MNTNQQMPATQNDAWGFWGTMNEHASIAWPLAMTAVSDATSQPLESVRVFLDSRRAVPGPDPGGRDQRRHPTMDGLDDWPPDQQAVRHPARPALPDGLCDSLRDRRGVARRLIIEQRAIRLAGGLLASPFLPAPHDHVHILRVEFDQPCQPP